MLFIKSQKGFSLIESVVGMVLLAILVGAILSVTLGDKTSARKNLTFNASCKAEAQRMMSEFKGKGLVRSYYSFPSQTAGALPAPGTHINAVNEPSASEVGLLFGQRWQNTGAPDEINAPLTIGNPTTGVLSTLRPYSLVMGTMSTLQSLHNNYAPNICSTAAASPGLLASSAPAPLSTIFQNPVGVEDSATSNTGLFDPDAYLRVALFNASTGGVVPNSCTAGGFDQVAMPSATNGMLNIIPPGLTNLNFPAGVPGPLRVGQIHPGVLFNHGFEVTITIDYDNRDGSRARCSVTEKFQYPMNMADTFRPLEPEDVDPTDTGDIDADAPEELNTFVRSNTANDYTSGNLPARNCNATNGELNFRVANARPGSTFMCRNLSEVRPITGPGFNIAGAPRRLIISSPQGLRQTFYSTELEQQLSSRNNGPNPDATPNAFGLYQFNSLYYPTGTYFCNSAEGCDNLPRFTFTSNPLEAPAALATYGNYSVRRPPRHAANQATPWTAASRTGRWVPCENAQIACAASVYGAGTQIHNPTTEFVKGTGNVADGYHIRYSGLEPGCEVHMQVAEVDPSYNVRAMEFHEYTHEKIPGDRLVHRAGDPATQWSFVCSTTNTIPAALPGLACPIAGVGTRTATTAQDYNLAADCYIHYPGSPTDTNDYRNGVWKSNPANSEAGP